MDDPEQYLKSESAMEAAYLCGLWFAAFGFFCTALGAFLMALGVFNN